MAETVIFDEVYDIPEEDEDELLFWEDKEMEFADFKRELETLAKPCAGFVITGTAGRWDGRRDVAQTVRGIRELLRLFDDCELRILDEDGDMLIEGHHHDATHFIYVRFLTYEGLEYLDGYTFEDSWYKTSKEVFDSDVYSRPIRYAERVWGIPAA